MTLVMIASFHRVCILSWRFSCPNFRRIELLPEEISLNMSMIKIFGSRCRSRCRTFWVREMSKCTHYMSCTELWHTAKLSGKVPPVWINTNKSAYLPTIPERIRPWKFTLGWSRDVLLRSGHQPTFTCTSTSRSTLSNSYRLLHQWQLVLLVLPSRSSQWLENHTESVQVHLGQLMIDK